MLEGLEFRDPLFLLLGLLAPLVYWLATPAPASVLYSSLELPQGTPRPLRPPLARPPATAVALSRPPPPLPRRSR